MATSKITITLRDEEIKEVRALVAGSHAPAAEERRPQGESCMSGLTFDAGALIALGRNERRGLTLIARAKERGLPITVPPTALAQAIRNPARQGDSGDFRRIAPELPLVAM